MSLPTVLLHDHLDGGLRPATILELAEAVGHPLPAADPGSLTCFFDQRNSGSLESYLEAFAHTVAVLQTADALTRAAREAAEDLAADGVVYAEVRFAPLLHTRLGLRPEGAVEAVLEGFRQAGPGLHWGVILCAIRSESDSEQVADLVVRYADYGVVGFDLAGPEAGFPPDAHLPAVKRVREFGLGVTLHAGEAAGVASIALAVNRCGADRVGHGVDIIQDCRISDGEITGLGRVARRVRDFGIPLEVCPSSNLATKGWRPEQHPVGLLHRAGFNVTINTDNRLMSSTTQSAEMELVERVHGLGIDDRAVLTRRALAAAFCSQQTRKRLWEERIAPAYRAAGASIDPRW